MAGAGYKLFNTGDVLTAAQVNTYLQEQTVMVFASAAARTTALASVLAEGMVSYLKDTNATEVYDGSSWVGIGNSGDITGVTAGTGISGGGTSGTVTITNSMATEITAAGDIIVGTGSGAFDNLPIGTTGQVLTADTTVSPYKVKWATASGASANYQLLNAGGTATTGAATITISGISAINSLFIYLVDVSAGASASFTLRVNGDSASNYYYVKFGQSSGAITTGGGNDAAWQLGTQGNATANKISIGEIRIDGCNAAGIKNYWAVTDTNGTADECGVYMGHYVGTSTVSSVSIISSSGNFDGGTIYVYGA